jgi:predicted phosphohydrolase
VQAGRLINQIRFDILKEHGIRYIYYGHIHGMYNIPRSTEFEGIRMTIVSADFLNFTPLITAPYEY